MQRLCYNTGIKRITQRYVVRPAGNCQLMKYAWVSTSLSCVTDIGDNINNLVELQIKACEIHKDYDFLGMKKGKQFEYITYGEFGEAVNYFRTVLASSGIGKDDKVR